MIIIFSDTLYRDEVFVGTADTIEKYEQDFNRSFKDFQNRIATLINEKNAERMESLNLFIKNYLVECIN